MKKLISSIILSILIFVMSVNPALAIGNPDTIAFTATGSNSRYGVFNNVLETGDWLVYAEGFVYYAVTPTDYTAKEAFLFQILDATGTVLASTPLQSYGDRPISIYLSKAQADGIGLTIGTGYVVRIVGNPNIFASTTGNLISVTLQATDYVDQLLGTGNTTATNPLDQAMILIAQDMQAYDSVTTYLITINGADYATSLGGSLFLTGIPNLNNMCPLFFQYNLSVLQNETPSHSGAYAGTVSVTNQWGATTANGLTALGSFMGMNQAVAGAMVWFLLMLAFAIFILYPRVQNTTTIVLFMAVTPTLGSFLGFITIPLAFCFALFIVIMVGYYFVSRGTM